MIEPNHPRLSIVRQCQLASIARSSHYYVPKGESPLNLEFMRLIDAQHLRTPWDGSRQLARHLRRQRLPYQPQADASIDASDGPDGHLPKAADVNTKSSTPDLPVSATAVI